MGATKDRVPDVWFDADDMLRQVRPPKVDVPAEPIIIDVPETITASSTPSLPTPTVRIDTLRPSAGRHVRRLTFWMKVRRIFS